MFLPDLPFSGYVIQQFNGIDILLGRTEEILRSGWSKMKEKKAQITDILESCISTLRILTKDAAQAENFQDPAKHAQHQIRNRFQIILYLYCFPHEFSDNKKIICVSRF